MLRNLFVFVFNQNMTKFTGFHYLQSSATFTFAILLKNFPFSDLGGSFSMIFVHAQKHTSISAAI